MNIIFLDIDGVLISLKTHASQLHKPLNLAKDWNKESCLLISQICKYCNCQIVFVSSHKIGYSENIEKFIFSESPLLTELKKHYLINYLHNPHWKTADKKTKGEEIENWLKTNKVDNYIIIDDNKNLYFEYQKEKIIECDFIHGYTFYDFLKTIQKLNYNLYVLTDENEKTKITHDNLKKLVDDDKIYERLCIEP